MAQNKEKIRVKILLPKFYRNIILFFLAVTLALSFGIFYYIFGRVRIYITPAYQKVSQEIMVDIKDGATVDVRSAKAVQGKLYSFELEEMTSIRASGFKEVQDNSVGKVILVNNNNQNQTLIATTRLLATNGTLLRLKDKVSIPAKSRAEAEVYPDAPETFVELQPTKFTIPGLWQALQDKIYAESVAVLRKNTKKIPVVTEDDIRSIDKVLLEMIDEKVREKLEIELMNEETFYSKLIQKEIVQKYVDAKSGDEKETINIKAKIRAIALIFDEIQLVNYCKKDIASTLSAGKRLESLDPKSIVYNVEKYDVNSGVATVKVYIEGKAVVKSENRIFDKKNLFGKNKVAVEKYFKDFPEIEKVEVEFYPSWIPRVPRSEEKIEIIMQ